MPATTARVQLKVAEGVGLVAVYVVETLLQRAEVVELDNERVGLTVTVTF